MKKCLSCLLLLFIISSCSKNTHEKEPNNNAKALTNMPHPTAQQGANVFQQRCELCHGSKGMGEGALALTIKDYPSTNLLQEKYSTDNNSVRQQIIFGGSRGEMHQLSPPWGDELTWTEIESTVLFIAQLRKNPEQAFKLLDAPTHKQKPKLELGRLTFNSRCTLCHGAEGKGDGKMAKIIKNPPPFDLTYSVMPDEYLMNMISKGGQAMQRSARMPPFGGDLSNKEIRSVIMYIKTLRDLS